MMNIDENKVGIVTIEDGRPSKEGRRKVGGYFTDYIINDKDYAPDMLGILQRLVGGPIETVTDGSHLLILHMDGKMKNLPLNEIATAFAHKQKMIKEYDFIVGPAVVARRGEEDIEFFDKDEFFLIENVLRSIEEELINDDQKTIDKEDVLFDADAAKPKRKSASACDIIENACSEFCRDYCKYSEIADQMEKEGKDGQEWIENKCCFCPLDRLW